MKLTSCLAGILLGCLMTVNAADAAPSVVLFDRQATGNIKTIGIVTVAMPAQPAVQDVAGAPVAGAIGGLIGGLAMQSVEDQRQKEFWAEIDGSNHPPQTTFLNALTAALQADGYTVRTLAVARPDAEFLSNYPADAGVDAILDVTFNEECSGYGYMTPGQEKANPYKPFAYVSFRLVRASDHTVLAQNTVLYTPWWKQDTEDSVAISPDAAYSFADYNAIKANPQLAAEGLNAALTQAANTIGTLLY